MAKRSFISRSRSRSQFKRNAGTHRKNVDPRPMRGGIRL